MKPVKPSAAGQKKSLKKQLLAGFAAVAMTVAAAPSALADQFNQVSYIAPSVEAAAESFAPVNITHADFKRAVLEESYKRPVVLEVWMETCGPCQKLKPILAKELAATEGRVLHARIDAETETSFIEEQKLWGVPRVMAYYRGQEVGHFTGSKSAKEVQHFLRGLQTVVDMRGGKLELAKKKASPAAP